MKPGRQWLFFDADFFDNSFTAALLNRFGAAGVVLFLAFLCACKRSHPQGQIRYRNEFEAIEYLGIESMPLVDQEGLPFTLEEFFTFTGRYKQTSRRVHGHSKYITATGWDEWQDSKHAAKAYERDRKRRWRAQQEQEQSRSSPDLVPFQSHFSPETSEQNRRSGGRNVRDNVPLDTDTDKDIRGMSRKSGKPKPPERPTYKPWEPEPEPQEPIVSKDAIASLLRRSTEVDG